MLACRICGRGLKDSTSIRREIGPVCWRKFYPEERSRPARPRRRSTPPNQMELPLKRTA